MVIPTSNVQWRAGICGDYSVTTKAAYSFDGLRVGCQQSGGLSSQTYVSFEDAARVSLDPNRIESFDGRDAYGKDRWKTVGLVEPASLAAVYTVRGKDSEVIRLI